MWGEREGVECVILSCVSFAPKANFCTDRCEICGYRTEIIIVMFLSIVMHQDFHGKIVRIITMKWFEFFKLTNQVYFKTLESIHTIKHYRTFH